jgi:hypothetical protein
MLINETNEFEAAIASGSSYGCGETGRNMNE